MPAQPLGIVSIGMVKLCSNFRFMHIEGPRVLFKGPIISSDPPGANRRLRIQKNFRFHPLGQICRDHLLKGSYLVLITIGTQNNSN